MPRVPTASQAGLGQLESRPLAAPAVPVGASPAAFGGVQAVQLGRLGAAVGDAGAVLGDVALRQQALLDDSRVDDVKTREWDASLQQQLNDPESGAFTRLGGAAVGVTKELAAKLAKRREEIAKGLDNDVQRQLFLRRTAPELDSAMDQLSRHEARELKVYRASANQAVIAGAANDALVNFTDPAAVQRSLDTIRSRVALNLEGLPPEAVAGRQRELVSAVHGQVVGRFLEREDPDGAGRWLAGHRADIDGAEQGRMEGAIATQRRQIEAQRLSEAREGFLADIQQRSARDPLGTRDALMGGDVAVAIEAVESAGDPRAVSAKGALGAMQLMPETAREAARDLGMPAIAGLPDDQLQARLLDDADLNRTLGRAYLDKMQRRYAGSRTLALAAYNAGPGQVDAWIEQLGDPRSGRISEAAWAERIPFAETRDYLRKVSARLAPSLRGPDDATTRRAQAYADQQADAHLRRLEQEWAPMEQLLDAGIEPAGIVDLAHRAAGTALEGRITAARQGQAEAAAFTALPLPEQLRQLAAMKPGSGAPDGAPAGLVTPGNIDVGARPQVRNSDGTVSTVRSMSVDIDGREVLLPTVSDDGRIMSDDEAVAAYERTGRHLGIFDSAEHATAYAERLHEAQARQSTVGEAVTYARLSKATAATVEMVKEDPLQAYALQLGLPLPAIDGSVEAYGRRRVIADQAAEWTGVAVSPLTKAEAGELATQLDSGSVDERLARIDALTRGFGEVAPALFAGLAPKTPVLAHVGRLAAQGADVTTLRDILVGQDMIRSGDADKVVEATRVDRAGLADATLNIVLGPEMAGARAQITAAADRLYLARATRAQKAQVFDADLYRTAIEEATGGRLDEVNGQLTLLPRDVDGDRVDSLLQTMTPELWKFASLSGSPPLGRDGKPLATGILEDAYLEAVGDGLFLVNLQPRSQAREYAGGGPDGGPFVLDLSRLTAAAP